MRARGILLILLFFGGITGAMAETVVDVSREWQMRMSSASVPTSSSVGSVQPGTGTIPAVQESTSPIACQCDSLTPQEHLEESTYAFTGWVAEVHASKNGKRTVVFDVDEIFKGSPKPEMKVTAEVSGTDCDLPFEEGQSYLVYAQWEWGSVITSRCMGTKVLEKAKTAALGPSQELKEKLYIRLRNTCMGRYDTPCCLSSLKAMRVGYFVPEPEEGCPSGTIPDRLRCAGSYTWCIPVTEKDHRQP